MTHCCDATLGNSDAAYNKTCTDTAFAALGTAYATWAVVPVSEKLNVLFAPIVTGVQLPVEPLRNAKNVGMPSAAQKRYATAAPPVATTVIVSGTVAVTVVVPVAVAVMVGLNEPVVAVALTTNDNDDVVPVTAAGVNVAVTPDGNPVTARLTVPANPPRRVIVTVLAPVAPCCMLTALAATVMPCAAVTVNAIVPVCAVTPVPVARTMMFVAAATAVEPTVNVSVLVVTPAVSVAGENDAVTPVGRASAVSAMSPVKLPMRTMVTVLVAVVPTAADNVGEPTASVILGTGATVSAIAVVRSV